MRNKPYIVTYEEVMEDYIQDMIFYANSRYEGERIFGRKNHRRRVGKKKGKYVSKTNKLPF